MPQTNRSAKRRKKLAGRKREADRFARQRAKTLFTGWVARMMGVNPKTL